MSIRLQMHAQRARDTTFDTKGMSETAAQGTGRQDQRRVATGNPEESKLSNAVKTARGVEMLHYRSSGGRGITLFRATVCA